MKKLITVSLAAMMAVSAPATRAFAYEKDGMSGLCVQNESVKFFSDFKTDGQQKAELSDEQKREIQSLRTQIWEASEKLIDEYVRLGLLDEESAAKIKSDKGQRHDKDKPRNKPGKENSGKSKVKADTDKFKTLSDAEKANIYKLSEDIIVLKKKLLDYEVVCGVKTKEQVDTMKARLDENFKDIKDSFKLRFIK